MSTHNNSGLKKDVSQNHEHIEDCYCMGGVFYPESEISKEKMAHPVGGGLYTKTASLYTTSPSGNFVNIKV